MFLFAVLQEAVIKAEPEAQVLCASGIDLAELRPVVQRQRIRVESMIENAVAHGHADPEIGFDEEKQVYFRLRINAIVPGRDNAARLFGNKPAVMRPVLPGCYRSRKDDPVAVAKVSIRSCFQPHIVDIHACIVIGDLVFRDLQQAGFVCSAYKDSLVHIGVKTRTQLVNPDK